LAEQSVNAQQDNTQVKYEILYKLWGVPHSTCNNPLCSTSQQFIVFQPQTLWSQPINLSRH
jgi:hypothetical protein